MHLLEIALDPSKINYQLVSVIDAEGGFKFD